MSSLRQGTTVRDRWYFPSHCQQNGKTYHVLKGSRRNDCELRTDPRVQAARKFIEEWNREFLEEESSELS
jgi:hypothetical protein